MMVQDLQPPSIVEDKGFCKLLSVLDGKYVPPSRHTIVHTLLPKQEELVKDRTLQELGSVESCSLTTDFWTSRAAKSYITVTCHFIDDKWPIKSYVLATYNVEASHMAKTVAHELEEIASRWKIIDSA